MSGENDSFFGIPLHFLAIGGAVALTAVAVTVVGLLATIIVVVAAKKKKKSNMAVITAENSCGPPKLLSNPMHRDGKRTAQAAGGFAKANPMHRDGAKRIGEQHTPKSPKADVKRTAQAAGGSAQANPMHRDGAKRIVKRAGGARARRKSMSDERGVRRQRKENKDERGVRRRRSSLQHPPKSPKATWDDPNGEGRKILLPRSDHSGGAGGETVALIFLTHDQVISFLRFHKLEALVPSFTADAVDGSMLNDMETKEDIGEVVVGHKIRKKKLLRIIQAARAEGVATECINQTPALAAVAAAVEERASAVKQDEEPAAEGVAVVANEGSDSESSDY